MATIDSGGQGGRKSVDQEIPLVPFIDLLLCCVMFLLVTAVWAQLGEMPTTLPGGADGPPASEQPGLTLQMSQDGYRLGSHDGTERSIANTGAGYDHAALRTQLERHRRDFGTIPPVYFQPDDDVNAGAVVATMDVLRGEGFASIAFPGAT